MDEQEISGNEIEVGDRVWWKRFEDDPPLGIWPSILSGKVRAIMCEEPDFHYAVVATDPDGRLLQPQLHYLVKGIYSGPEEQDIAVAPQVAPDSDVAEEEEAATL